MKSVSLDKNQRRIGRMFDRIASTYDILNHLLSMGLDLWWRTRAVASLQLKPSSLVLDVATGTGDFGLAVLHRYPGTSVIGLDLAPSMLRLALRKARKKGFEKSFFSMINGDALHLPFRDGTFDAVTIAYGIRNVPEIMTALREFRRVLRPGGKILILEFSLPTTPFFGQVYRFYFQRILPLVGGWISRDPEAYSYLPRSVGAFISPERMVEKATAAGFQSIETRSLIGGVTYYLRAMKGRIEDIP